MRITLVGVLATGLAVAALGVGNAAAGTRALAGRTSAPGSIRVTLVASTHKPKVNLPWPVNVTVSSSTGKPVAATLTMLVLFGGSPVGKIDNGAVYHFVGTWKERAGNEITWPAASRGQPLTVQFVVQAQGHTVRKNWAIQVS